MCLSFKEQRVQTNSSTEVSRNFKFSYNLEYIRGRYTLLGSKPEVPEYHLHRLLHSIVHNQCRIERHQSKRRRGELYAQGAEDI